MEEKPVAVEEKPTVKQSKDVAPKNSQPAIKPAETVSLPKRVEHKPRERAMSPDDADCSQRYQSYDPASGTYMGYDGQRHSCR
jgi:BA14K-like protein